MTMSNVLQLLDKRLLMLVLISHVGSAKSFLLYAYSFRQCHMIR